MSSLKRKTLDGQNYETFSSIKIGKTNIISSATSTTQVDINALGGSGGGGEWNPNAIEVLTNKNISDVSNTLPNNVMRKNINESITGVKTFTAAPVISAITNTGTLTLPTATGTLALTSQIPDPNLFVDKTSAQTVTGVKTFSSPPEIASITNAGSTLTLPNVTGQLARVSQIPTTAQYVDRSSDQSVFGSKTFSKILNSTLAGCRLIDDSELPGGGLKMRTVGDIYDTVLDVNLTAERTLTVPDNSGTIALTSDLTSLVNLITSQSIGGTKTFLSTLSANGILNSAGTAALPSYSFTGLNSCGMSYDSVTNGLTLSCGGAAILYSRVTGLGSQNMVIPTGKLLIFQRSDLGVGPNISNSGVDMILSSSSGGAKFALTQNIGNTNNGGCQLRTGTAQEMGYQVTDAAGSVISVNLNKLGSTTINRSALYLAPTINSISASQPYFTYFASPVVSGTVVTTAATVFIQGPPSAGFVTTPYSFQIGSGNSLFGGTIRTTDNGTTNSPSISVGTFVNSGLYNSSNNLGIVNGGAEIARFGASVGFESNVSTSFGTPALKSGEYLLNGSNALGGISLINPVIVMYVGYGGSGVFNYTLRVTQCNITNNAVATFDIALPFTTQWVVGVGQGTTATAIYINAQLQSVVATSVWTVTVRSSGIQNGFAILLTGSFRL